ncbi:MAG: hypothetical protein JWM12_3557 [Ilumatobacteraceae bacterium]|nr:hypothetical protein [Ilumatobacteraceae bacterium]
MTTPKPDASITEPVEREGTLSTPSAGERHRTGEAMARHNADVDPPA